MATVYSNIKIEWFISDIECDFIFILETDAPPQDWGEV